MPRPLAAREVIRVLEVLVDEEDRRQQRTSAIRYSRCLPKSFSFSDAHAITIVTDEPIRMKVLAMPSQTFSSPCGHSGAPMRRMM